MDRTQDRMVHKEEVRRMLARAEAGEVIDLTRLLIGREAVIQGIDRAEEMRRYDAGCARRAREAAEDARRRDIRRVLLSSGAAVVEGNGGIL